MPDFDNWRKHFSDVVVKGVTPDNKPTYELDQDLLPSSLVDVDDSKVGPIAERTQAYYPDDNSIMRVINYEVGGKSFKKSHVIKDNLTFGLRERVPKEVPEEYGLVSYNTVGESEFWLNFEDDSKMLVELQ